MNAGQRLAESDRMEIYHDIDDVDRNLSRIAADTIRRVYHDRWHTVGAAVLCETGKIYAGVNVEFSGGGVCAETIALGRAITEGETQFKCIVAVFGRAKPPAVIPPCGTCRQALVDYAPDCWVILQHGGQLVKARAAELLPDPYTAHR